MTSKLEQSIKIFIEQAVARTRITAANAPQDAYKATEKRLYAYPVLRERIADLRERIAEISYYGAREPTNLPSFAEAARPRCNRLLIVLYSRLLMNSPNSKYSSSNSLLGL